MSPLSLWDFCQFWPWFLYECLVSLGRSTLSFTVPMYMKLAKCIASSMIRFSFHRATVIYEAYFHVVTRKCFHLMIGQCTFLYQTCSKSFYCFKNTFSQEICCFHFKGALFWFAKAFRLLDEACSLLEHGEETWADGQCAKQEFTSLSSVTSPDTAVLGALEHVTSLPCMSCSFPLVACNSWSLLTADLSTETLALTGACRVPSVMRVHRPGCHKKY